MIEAMIKRRSIDPPKAVFAAVKPMAPCVKMVGMMTESEYKRATQK